MEFFQADDWKKVEQANWPWFFTPKEMACKHTGKLYVCSLFMTKLEDLRKECGFPFIVNSGYRHKTHPVERKKSKPGAHALGMAVDIRVAHGGQVYEVITKARMFGFTGIGLETGFIHLDICTTRDLGGTVRPAMWTY